MQVLSPPGSAVITSSVQPLSRCAERSTVPSDTKAGPGGPSLHHVSLTSLGALLEQHRLWWASSGDKWIAIPQVLCVQCSILPAPPPDEGCLAGVMFLLAELYGSGGAYCVDRGDGGALSEPYHPGLRATHKAAGIFTRTTVEELLQASLCMLYAILAPQLVEGQSGSSQSAQGS